MIVLIDNYDSFTYNLVQYFGELGLGVKVFRNDEITPNGIRKLRPSHIVISPGPGRPDDAGISKSVINDFKADLPILGVCLGHQCVGEVFGASIVRAKRLMHGKTSLVYHNKKSIFKNIKSPFQATRYHSLIVKRENLPQCLEIIAQTRQKEIMAVKHRQYPVWGVQFHPESILTTDGKRLLKNFIGM
ncbi:MAG: aminodeoxychorismate/anthranilate synthase component II [Candidatus Omnitrophica bacterium]|jgi:anthranilate synthase/aminodeoxychorismate synthase-like glutamine amidotransferase|nr:aminodeoxychorismate/anthranilate synthase component II [Candidatus Omnitrophota bacterium]